MRSGQLSDTMSRYLIQRIEQNPNIAAFVRRCASGIGEEMLAQGKEMFTRVPNAYIRYPCTHEGLKAAEMSVRERNGVCSAYPPGKRLSAWLGVTRRAVAFGGKHLTSRDGLGREH